MDSGFSKPSPSDDEGEIEESTPEREQALEAMRQASEQELIDQIRRQLALPMNKRTHFLRKRLPNGGSCL